MGTVPVEITWTTSQVVTAAQMNANVRDGVNWLLTPLLFIGRQTVAQSLANAIWTSINLDVEDIDRDNAHSTSTNTSRYTSATAGYYDTVGSVGFSSNSTGARGAKGAINGTSQQGRCTFGAAVVTDRCCYQWSGSLFLNVGDFLETYGFQTSGGALNTDVGVFDIRSSMTARWVST